MKTKTSRHTHSRNLSPVRPAFLLTALVLICFALAPRVRAVDPPPDGGYLNQNTAEGEDALFSLTNGVNNTAIGFNALYGGTSGDNNTAIGAYALHDNTDINGFAGDENTAVGVNALYTNTQGPENTAIGFNALFSNTTAEGNTATGWEALASTTTGSFNTATGWAALISNTGGSNTATGAEALLDNSTGFGNTATGAGALVLNTTGNSNTATGISALFDNLGGNDNTATGAGALNDNNTGNDNTAMGFNALHDNRKGSNNIALGSSAGSALTTGDNNIDIGNPGFARESNHIRIGTVENQKHTFIAGISGSTVPTGIAVIVDADGHLGTTTSSARFKEAIKPMDNASEAVLALKPVTFRYKHELDPAGVPQFGLVAEDVEKVNPDLVARDDQGKPYSIRYEAVNAMLLNEFLKEHRTVQQLRSASAKQEATIAHQQKQIETLNAGLQKVSDQLELSKSASQTAVNNQ